MKEVTCSCGKQIPLTWSFLVCPDCMATDKASATKSLTTREIVEKLDTLAMRSDLSFDELGDEIYNLARDLEKSVEGEK